MNCKIRSYNYVRAKIFGKKPTILGEIISWRSKPHKHNEFQFSKRHAEVSFSATTMGGYNCARFEDIGYSHEAERWDTVIVPMTDEQEDKAYAEAVIQPELFEPEQDDKDCEWCGVETNCRHGVGSIMVCSDCLQCHEDKKIGII